MASSLCVNVMPKSTAERDELSQVAEEAREVRAFNISVRGEVRDEALLSKKTYLREAIHTLADLK